MGIVAVGLIPLILSGSPSPASDGEIDPAKEAMRREVQARKRLQEAAFARIKALPAAAPVQAFRVVQPDLIAWQELG